MKCKFMGESKFKLWFWQRKVRSVLRHATAARKTSGLSDAYRIGIYHAFRNAQEMESLLGFAARLTQAGKRVKVLTYVPAKTMPRPEAQEGFVSFFCKRDVDWRFFPRREINPRLEDFLTGDYDLLLDFSAEFHYTDVAVMAMCDACMKVGKFTPWNLKVNDLCLAPEAGENHVEGFIKALETYMPLFDGAQNQKK